MNTNIMWLCTRTSRNHKLRCLISLCHLICIYSDTSNVYDRIVYENNAVTKNRINARTYSKVFVRLCFIWFRMLYNQTNCSFHKINDFLIRKNSNDKIVQKFCTQSDCSWLTTHVKNFKIKISMVLTIRCVSLRITWIGQTMISTT